MVNPDGVIHGSSRCNMAGLDLNRQWGESIIKVNIANIFSNSLHRLSKLNNL